MKKSIFYTNISSRLGLRFAPMGSNSLNIGVENGGQAILEAIQLTDPSRKVPDLCVNFQAPEFIDGELYLSNVFELYADATSMVIKKWHNGSSLITLGGDHSISYISLSAILESYGEQNVAVVMFDSHADLHLPETSPTGNFHGMWLRTFFDDFSQLTVTNRKLKPNQLQFVGNLLIEDEEKRFIKEAGILVHGTTDISKTIIAEMLTWAAQFPHLHISFDVDVFSQSLVSATGIPNPNGFYEEEIFPILRELKMHPSISLDIVEFNPQKNGADKTLRLIKKVCNTIF